MLCIVFFVMYYHQSLLSQKSFNAVITISFFNYFITFYISEKFREKITQFLPRPNSLFTPRRQASPREKADSQLQWNSSICPSLWRSRWHSCSCPSGNQRGETHLQIISSGSLTSRPVSFFRSIPDDDHTARLVEIQVRVGDRVN